MERVDCAICDEDHCQTLLTRDGFTVVRCARCGLVYVNPRPEPDVLRAIYEDPHYFAGSHWYHDYLGYEQNYRRLFRQVLAILNDESSRRGTLLEVGCAAGFFLDEARRQEWKVQGLEISPEMSNYGRRVLGLDIQVASVDEAEFDADAFDAVVFCDSLEHFVQPAQTLSESIRILRPGGVLLILSPNISSLLARAMGRRWPHFAVPEHLYYFSPRTLTLLVQRAGFMLLHLRTVGRYFGLEELVAKLLPFSKPLLESAGKRILQRSVYLPVGDLLLVARRPT